MGKGKRIRAQRKRGKRERKGKARRADGAPTAGGVLTPPPARRRPRGLDPEARALVDETIDVWQETRELAPIEAALSALGEQGLDLPADVLPAARRLAVEALEDAEPGARAWRRAERVARSVGVPDEQVRRVALFEGWRRGHDLEPRLAALPAGTAAVLRRALAAVATPARSLDPSRLKRQVKADLRDHGDPAGLTPTLPDVARHYALARRGERRQWVPAFRRALDDAPAPLRLAACALGRRQQLVEELVGPDDLTPRGAALHYVAKELHGRQTLAAQYGRRFRDRFRLDSALLVDYADHLDPDDAGAGAARAGLRDGLEAGDPEQVHAALAASRELTLPDGEARALLDAACRRFSAAVAADAPAAARTYGTAALRILSAAAPLDEGAAAPLREALVDRLVALELALGDPDAELLALGHVLRRTKDRLAEDPSDPRALADGLAAAARLRDLVPAGAPPRSERDDPDAPEVPRAELRLGALGFLVEHAPDPDPDAARALLDEAELPPEVRRRVLARFEGRPATWLRLCEARDRRGTKALERELERAAGDGAGDVAALVLVEALEQERLAQRLPDFVAGALRFVGSDRERELLRSARGPPPDRSVSRGLLRRAVKRLGRAAEPAWAPALAALLAALDEADELELRGQAQRLFGDALRGWLAGDAPADDVPSRAQRLGAALALAPPDAAAVEAELRALRRQAARAPSEPARALAAWQAIDALARYGRLTAPALGGPATVAEWQEPFLRGLERLPREVAWRPIADHLASPEAGLLGPDVVAFVAARRTRFPGEPAATLCAAVEPPTPDPDLLRAAEAELRARPLPALEPALERARAADGSLRGALDELLDELPAGLRAALDDDPDETWPGDDDLDDDLPDPWQEGFGHELPW